MELNIDDDVLSAAREVASRRRVSIGKALSMLARQAMTRASTEATRSGFPLFPLRPDAGIVTPELIAELRDEEP
ncbi:MAG: CopG family transcriptional regulator [Armatimonadetes bacterium]|nr:CopG family transcriptional regulator [Armatimonadota bacterium]